MHGLKFGLFLGAGPVKTSVPIRFGMFFEILACSWRTEDFGKLLLLKF